MGGGRGEAGGQGTYNRRVLNGTRLWLSLDSRAACALRLRRGLTGPRLEAFERAPLPPAAHEPTPAGPALRDAGAVQHAAARALAGVGARPGERAALLLPDGLARVVLLQVPPRVEPEQYARFRLGGQLPFAPSEAIFGSLRLPGGRHAAAGLRRALVEAYEGLARSLGLAPDGAFLASLAALENGQRQGWRDALAVLLGDSTTLLVALRGGHVAALRHLLRAGTGEPSRLLAEGRRTLSTALLPEKTAWHVAGYGARALAHALAVAGQAAQAAGPALTGAPEATEELDWLGGLPA